MRKKGKALLAALLLLLVLTGCGADSAAQPEPGTVAAAMAEITAEKIDDGFIDQYPQITVEQLVTALHDAVSCEITKEEAEAAGYGQEDGWCVIIPVSGSPDLGLSWDKTLDIVQVIDTSVLYSSSYPHPEGSIAYFRCHALYQLVSQCREETPTVAERMAAIRPEDIGSLYYPNVTAEQLAEYRRQAELRGTPESKVRRWMGMQIFYFSHAGDVDHAWAASRSVEELDVVVGNHVQAKKQYDTWTEEDEAGYQIYLQEQDMEKRTYRAWYLIANPRKLPKEIVNQELAFRFKLFPDKMDKKK